MAPYSVLVTGANRGIGLGLVKEFLKNKDIQHVIATARKPTDAKVSQFCVLLRVLVVKHKTTAASTIAYVRQMCIIIVYEPRSDIEGNDLRCFKQVTIYVKMA